VGEHGYGRFCGALLRWTAAGGCPYVSYLALRIAMWDDLRLATNFSLDKLLEEARRAGKRKTTKSALTAALAEYIQMRKQLRILEAFGGFEFDPAYDYKAERRRQRP
jgi:hypothetical protein